jgi:hypothetical protein
MKNKNIETADFSDCIDDDMSNFAVFLQKIDRNKSIKFLTLDGMMPGLSNAVEPLGEALGKNKKLEVLNMRRVRIKSIYYREFWNKLCDNKHLKKINIQKTDCNDFVSEGVANYISTPDIKLVELDLSCNLITDIGVAKLC